MRIRVADLSPAAQAQILAKGGTPVLPQAKAAAWSAGEGEFAFHCRALKLPEPMRQHRFAQGIGRQWRFDFCWPPWKVALEVEGLALYEKDKMNGHTSIDGFEGDCEKYANAAIMGWTVIRFTQRQVKSGFALDCLTKLLRAKGWTNEQVQEKAQATTSRPIERPPQVDRGGGGGWTGGRR